MVGIRNWPTVATGQKQWKATVLTATVRRMRKYTPAHMCMRACVLEGSTNSPKQNIS
jgi:hypothetical protein